LVSALFAGRWIISTVTGVDYDIIVVVIVLITTGQNDRVCALGLAPRNPSLKVETGHSSGMLSRKE
jgi:hypothetical protein